MRQDTAKERRQAHELIERLPARQVSAVVGLLEAMLDPVSRAIADAPADDEPESVQERQAVAESKTWFEQQQGGGVPHEEVAGDVGFTPEDFSAPKGRT